MITCHPIPLHPFIVDSSANVAIIFEIKCKDPTIPHKITLDLQFLSQYILQNCVFSRKIIIFAACFKRNTIKAHNHHLEEIREPNLHRACALYAQTFLRCKWVCGEPGRCVEMFCAFSYFTKQTIQWKKRKDL